MKTRFFRFLGIAIIMVAFSASAFGQSAASANASARIIAPISIAKNVGGDLHFGTIIRAAGDVTVTPAGGRSTTGPVLSALAPAHTAAAFTVTGEASLTYTISLSAGPVLISDGTNTMSVNTFVSSPAAGVGTGTLGAGGTQALTVGATLTVGAAQPSGTYTLANAFTVTVNYN